MAHRGVHNDGLANALQVPKVDVCRVDLPVDKIDLPHSKDAAARDHKLVRVVEEGDAV